MRQDDIHPDSAALNDSMFTGTSAVASARRIEGERSGLLGGYMVSGDGVLNPADSAHERKRKSEELSQIQLRIQIGLFLGNLREMAQRMMELRDRIAGLDDRIITLNGLIDKNAENRNFFADMDQDMDLATFYNNHYQGRVLDGGPGSLLEALNHPLRDEDGNLVYSDAQGLYRLKGPGLDGMPEREYYLDSDPHQIPELMRQIRQDHKLLAQFTPLSEDPGNMRLKEIVDISKLPRAMTAHLDGIAPPPEGSTIASVTTAASLFLLCDQVQCILVEEMEATEEAKAEAEAELEDVQEEAETLIEDNSDIVEEFRDNGGDMTEIDQTLELIYNPEEAALKQAVMDQVEAGIVTRATLDLMLADADPSMVAKIDDMLHRRGVTIQEPFAGSVLRTAAMDLNNVAAPGSLHEYFGVKPLSGAFGMAALGLTEEDKPAPVPTFDPDDPEWRRRLAMGMAFAMA